MVDSRNSNGYLMEGSYRLVDGVVSTALLRFRKMQLGIQTAYQLAVLIRMQLVSAHIWATFVWKKLDGILRVRLVGSECPSLTKLTGNSFTFAALQYAYVQFLSFIVCIIPRSFFYELTTSGFPRLAELVFLLQMK